MGTVYRSFTQAQLDAEYEPRSTVTEEYLRAFRKRCEERSEQARTDLACNLNISFGPEATDRLDAFWATNAAVAPTCVFFHGGYWRSNHKEDFSYVALGLAPLGINVVVVEYPLLPALQLPQVIQHCRSALTWVARELPRLGGGTERICLCGHSAGAHLLAMLLCTDWSLCAPDLAPDFIKAAVALSGLYDLLPIQLSAVNATLALSASDVENCSPVHLRPVVACPLELLVGSDESSEFKRQSQVLADRWMCALPALRLNYISGANHYSIRGLLDDPAGEVCDLIHKHSFATAVPNQSNVQS